MFDALFGSEDADHAPAERQWILKVVEQSLRSDADHRVLARRHVLQRVMAIYDAKSLSDPLTRGKEMDH